MRKVYILRDEEEDGLVLDCLVGTVNFDELENPRCPLCGAATLLAYAEDGEYSVLTWFCLTEDEEVARPEAWYLICHNLECRYEEQVERVSDPVGAVLFDLLQSHQDIEEEIGLSDGYPAWLKGLITSLEQLQRISSHRKLPALLKEARWHYKEQMTQRRTWIKQIPVGRKIEFDLDGNRIRAIFMAATAQTMLVRILPDGEIVGVDLEDIEGFRPIGYDLEEELTKIDSSQKGWILLNCGPQEYLVAKGHHLRLECVDRFGLYRVATRDLLAGVTLGLEQKAEDFWSGYVRRSDIEARYKIRPMIKVKGHWVTVYGEAVQSHSPAVYTEDPVIAAALGLEPSRIAWRNEQVPKPPERWYGVIPQGEVEESDEVRLYLWPIPEVQEK